MIHIDKIDTKEALRYMGYRENMDISLISPIISSCEKELINTALIRWCYRIFDIEHTKDSVNIKGTSLKLTGSSISEHLKECTRAILLACTLSDTADRLISRYSVTDMTRALITDALASAMIEQVCNKAENIIKEENSISHMTWRFSPGYGDLPIDIQKKFISVLNADKQIGLTVTQDNILIPRKSVTAVSGISDSPIPPKKRGCAVCSMSETCNYRKRGTHCGL